MALMTHKLKSWPFAGKIAIKEKNSENDKTQMHVFQHWTYLGSAEDDDDLAELELKTTQLKFDLDTYKLLLKAIDSSKTQIIQF
jgi:DNA polymerase III subunit epsilon